MADSGRGVVALFGATVAAALGAVCWLVFSTPAPSERGTGAPSTTPTPRPAGTGTTPPKPMRPPRTPKPGTGGKDRPKPPPVEILGQVLAPDGQPAAGATVSVFSPPAEPPAPATGGLPATELRIDPDALRELFALDPDEAKTVRSYTGVPVLPARGPAPAALATATTGEDGRFRFALGRRGTFRLQARKEGVGEAVASQVTAGGEPAELRLGSSASLEGRVVDGGTGVAEATVVVRSGSVEKGATTGPDGSFRVEELPPGKYAVTAGAAGHAPANLPAVEVPAPAPLEISLAGGFSIRVNVMKYEPPPPGWKRSSGQPRPPGPPLEGAQVILYKQAGGAFLAATSGPDGQARFERLGEGLWRIGARRDGYFVGFGKEVRFKAGATPEETREIRLQPAVATPVRVTDSAGVAVRNARVFTGGLDEDFDERHSRLVGRTDEEGKVSAIVDENVPWKSVLWIVPEDGGGAMRLEPEDATSGNEEKVVIHPGRVVQGTITDTAGKGLAGAEIGLEVIDDERDIDITLHAYSDAQGKYRFFAVPFGEVALEVDAEGDYQTEDVDAENRESPLVRDFRIETDPAKRKKPGQK